MAKITVKGKRPKLDGRVALTPRRQNGEQTPHTNLGPEIEYGTRRKGGRRGRPTDYKASYCDDLLRYFGEAVPWTVNTTEKGAQQVIPKDRMPTIARFAQASGLGVGTIYRWARAHEEFAEALAEALELQKAFVMESGGIAMQAGFATFMLKACHNVRDDAPIEEDDADNGDVEVQPQGRGQGDE